VAAVRSAISWTSSALPVVAAIAKVNRGGTPDRRRPARWTPSGVCAAAHVALQAGVVAEYVETDPEVRAANPGQRRVDAGVRVERRRLRVIAEARARGREMGRARRSGEEHQRDPVSVSTLELMIAPVLIGAEGDVEPLASGNAAVVDHCGLLEVARAGEAEHAAARGIG
jgi:hypothetical protein